MIKLILALKRREGMSHDEFTHYQRQIHRPLLMAIPESEQYLRRFLVSYPIHQPGEPAPQYDSIVEAWFDTMDDLNGLFSSTNFLESVDPDHENFIDLTSVVRMICEEDVVIDNL